MKLLMRGLSLITCLAVIPWSVGWAADYYVAPDGDDGGQGAIGDPWLTPQKAANVAEPGDVIYLREGVYRPDGFMSSIVNFTKAGEPGNPITMKAYPGEIAELNGMLDYSDPDLWTCETGDVNCYAEGLVAATTYINYPDIPVVVQDDQALEWVRSLDDLVPGAYYWDGGDHRLYVNPVGGGNPGNYTLQVAQSNQVVLFETQGQYINLGDEDGELKVTGSFYGIRAQPNGGNRAITNVTLRHFREDAIKFHTVGNSGDVVQGCRISSYGDFGIDAYNSNNQLFKGNDFTGIHPWKSGGAIKLIKGPSDIVIDGNKVRSMGGLGWEGAFEVREATNVDIVNNIIVDAPLSAILVYGQESMTSNVRIANNTIYRTGGSAIWISFDENRDVGVKDIGLYNNIVDNSEAGCDFCRLLRVDAGGETGFTSDNNDFYRPGLGKVMVRWLGVNYYTLGDYRAVSGQDSNSIDEDPLFEDAAGGNFVPMADSPVINSGLDSKAPSTDIDGIARPRGLAVDMGAYEMGESDPEPIPGGTITGLTDASVVCINQAQNTKYRGLIADGAFSCGPIATSGEELIVKLRGTATGAQNLAGTLLSLAEVARVKCRNKTAKAKRIVEGVDLVEFDCSELTVTEGDDIVVMYRGIMPRS